VRRRRAALALLLVAAALSVAWSSRRLDQERAQHPAGAQILYLPSGRYLKVASLGFPELLADLVYIWSIQYYGHYDRADRFTYLEHIYGGVISELDPHYIDPYLVGSMIMGMEAGDHEMALRLLDKGMEANPNEWILPFEAGFVCFNSLGDHARAARYFERALSIPGAPPVIRRLHAEMYNKMGDKRTSLEHWRQVYDQAGSDYVRDVSWMHVHDLTIEVDLQDLRAAVQAYRERAGVLPPDLQALERAGLVRGEPVDPDGQPYRYDRATGEVSSASRFRLRRKAGA
jgi:tetratricopeptide (TPR) repeat protein